jgi:undecaprenyl-diphosphatase
MNTLQAFLIAILEGLTEYLPILDSPHGFFSVRILEFKKTILSNFFRFLFNSALFWLLLCIEKKFFDFSTRSVAVFYLKLIYAVIPALILGKLFDENRSCARDPIPIAIVLILGGVILLLLTVVFKSYNC